MAPPPNARGILSPLAWELKSSVRIEARATYNEVGRAATSGLSAPAGCVDISSRAASDAAWARARWATTRPRAPPFRPRLQLHQFLHQFLHLHLLLNLHRHLHLHLHPHLHLHLFLHLYLHLYLYLLLLPPHPPRALPAIRMQPPKRSPWHHVHPPTRPQPSQLDAP